MSVSLWGENVRTYWLKWVSPSPKYVRMGADDRVNRMQDGQQPPVGRDDESTIPERVCG